MCWMPFSASTFICTKQSQDKRTHNGNRKQNRESVNAESTTIECVFVRFFWLSSRPLICAQLQVITELPHSLPLPCPFNHLSLIPPRFMNYYNLAKNSMKFIKLATDWDPLNIRCTCSCCPPTFPLQSRHRPCCLTLFARQLTSTTNQKERQRVLCKGRRHCCCCFR